MIRSNRKPEVQKSPQPSKSLHFSYVVDVKYETIEERIARLRRGMPESSTPSPKNYSNYRSQLLPPDLRRSLTHSNSTDTVTQNPRSTIHDIPKRSRPNFDLIHAKKSTQALRKWKYDSESSHPSPSQLAKSILQYSEEEQTSGHKNPEDNKSRYNELVEDMDRVRGSAILLPLDSQGPERMGRVRNLTGKSQWTETEGKRNNQEHRNYQKKESYQDRPVGGISKIRKLPIHMLMGRP